MIKSHFQWIFFISSQFYRFISVFNNLEGAFHVAQWLKNQPANAGDTRDAGLISGSGRSPGGGHGNPLWYSCWEIPWTEEPGGLQSVWSQRVGHHWAHFNLFRRTPKALLHQEFTETQIGLWFFPGHETGGLLTGWIDSADPRLIWKLYPGSLTTDTVSS